MAAPAQERSKFTYRQLAQLAKCSVDSPLRVIAHIDLDAFYAQVEAKRLSLPPDTPLAVQQWQNLIAVNYAARAHGVTRHETATDALKRCPTLRLVHVATWRCGDPHWRYHADPSMATHKACLDPYRAEGRRILAVFRSACPRVEKASIDESFLDLSAMVHAALLARYPVLALPAPYGDPLEMLPLPGVRAVEWAGSCVLEKEQQEEEQVLDWDDVAMAVAAEMVAAVRERVRVEVGYTCSAGIAGNKMLAKLASGYKKPDSQTVVLPGAVQKFLNTLEFTKIRNLGGKFGSQISTAFNTSSLSALAALTLPQLHAKLPADDATWLHNTLRGLDRTDITPRTGAPKSMLSAKSFRPPLTSPAQAQQWLRVFVADIHARMLDEQEDAEAGGRRRPTVMTIMHRGAAVQRTRQVQMAGRAGVPDMLAVAEALLRAVVAEGAAAAWPCAGLSLQVGGFEERESGSRGIAGFLVKRAVEGEGGRETGVKRSRGEVVEREMEGEGEEGASPRSSALPVGDGVPGDDAPLSPPPPPPPPTPPTAAPPAPSPAPSLPPPPQDTDTASSAETYTCPQCNTPIPLHDQAEHEDWHFAKSLAEQDRLAAAAARPPPPPPPPPRGKKAPPPSKRGKKGAGGGLEKGQSTLAFGKG